MAQVKIAKRNLRNLLANGYSLRKLEKKLNGAVSFQVLGRFVKEKDYIPADENVRMALGLFVPPNPYRGMPRWWERTPKALAFFTRKREQVKQMFDDAKRERTSWKKV